jgi:hypothetical protein|tara:strand:- start:4860 stop:5144 length:285 start_codon:yes stop_codon:yes gene_type:complete
MASWTNKKLLKFAFLVAIASVMLNLVLPYLLEPYALSGEIKPPDGADKLSLKGQFMHMMVHHNQVPLMSSVIVALISGLSVVLAGVFKKSVLYR